MRRLITFRNTVVLLIALLICGGSLSLGLSAQNQYPSAIVGQLTASGYYLIPISATGAASAQVTLTIPAPPPTLYNYVCTVHFNASHDNTATTAATNSVTTSTNFNSYAIKFSLNNVANQNYDFVDSWIGAPGTGCARSASPGTATTFVSPAAAADIMFTWTATYFQAP